MHVQLVSSAYVICDREKTGKGLRVVVKMPGVISASDFIRETREDLSSPTTSNFVSRIPQCKETVLKLEEVGQLNHIKLSHFVRR